MVGLTLREYFANEPTLSLKQRRVKVWQVLSNAKLYPSIKTIAHRAGLTVNQVEYVFRTFPEVREMRRRLKVSKSLKQMAYDTIETHQETIADLRAQLAKANERVAEISSVLSAICNCIEYVDNPPMDLIDLLGEAQEQLRKEQE